MCRCLTTAGVSEGFDRAYAAVKGGRYMRLQERIAIVTGAGSGNGRAIARGMAGEGAHVMIVDVNQQGAEASIQEVAAFGCQTLVLRVDVSQVRDIEAMVRAVSIS